MIKSKKKQTRKKITSNKNKSTTYKGKKIYRKKKKAYNPNIKCFVFSKDSKFFLSNINHFIQSEREKSNIELKNFYKKSNIITQENYMSFNYKGIWFKYNKETKQVIDVLITTNVSREYKQSIRRQKYSKRYKFSEMRKLDLENIECYYLCSFGDWEHGLDIEYNFAKYTNAILWSPCKGYQLDRYNKEVSN